ncbi:WD40-repeat-containing domain protein [Chytriomyces cf. hyalinus JEL632]|nr:WD40-repeat-containing domain protein [Chytriomyces cf. hyalinus JEL632]
MGSNKSKPKKPAPPTTSSPMRGPPRKTNQPPLKNSSVELSKAAPLHAPKIVVEKTADAPGVQLPIVPHEVAGKVPRDVTYNVPDEKPASVPVTPVAPVNAVAPPRIELRFQDGTLGTEIQPLILDDLARAFEAMIKQLDEKSGSQVDVGGLIQQIEDVAVRASAFAENAKSLLAKVSIISSNAGEAVEKFIATIDSVTSTHPLLKLSWFVVYAGYKMVKDASELYDKYSELPGRFQAVLESVHAFLEIRILGIENEKTRRPLVKASEDIILCLTDAAVLFTKYMDKPGTTLSNLDGNNKKRLNQMDERLASVQKAHKTAQEDGLVPILTNGIADIKESMGGLLTGVDGLNTRLDGLQETIVNDQAAREAIVKDQAARDKKKSVEELFDLCKEKDPNVGEVTALVNRCAKGTRKWIVDQALESIENGEEKITWLRCEAGTGKSVIAGRVAHELKQKGLLGAKFFCKVNTKREKIVCLIQTIALELANVNDQFRKALIETLKAWGYQDVNESKKKMPNIEKLLQLFIEEPMEAWPKNISVVVVIDALDEISNMSNNIHVLLDTFLRLSSVKLFITSRPEIKDESIEISTATKKSSVALMAFKQNDERNLEDIRMFATSRVDTLFAKFPAFGTNKRKGLVEMLVKNSTGLFIWITLILDVDGHDSPLDKGTGKKIQRAKVIDSHVRKPKTSNELVNRLEAYASMGLQELYCTAFSKAFLDDDEMEKEFRLNFFRASVGTLMVMKVPISKDQLPYLVASGDDDMFDVILASLNQISALLRVDDNGKLSFIHKTVQEYLIGIALSQDKKRFDNLAHTMNLSSIYSCHLNSHECDKDVNFKLDFDKASFNLAIACLNLLNSDSSDVSDSSDASDSSDDSDDSDTPVTSVAPAALALFKNMAKLDERANYCARGSEKWNIDNVLSESLQYAIFYWSDHFTYAFPDVDLQRQCQLITKLKLFCETRLLYYLEAIVLADRLEMVAAAVNQILLCLNVIPMAASPFPSAQIKSSILSHSISSSNDNPYSGTLLADVAFICSILKDLKLVSINFKSQLAASPLQVYNYALTCVPQQTTYYHQYQKDLLVRLIIGGKQNWGPLSLSGHSGSVKSVAVTPDGKTIVSGSDDMKVKVWDTETGICTSTLEDHSDWVTSVAMTPDGKTIVSGSDDMTVKVWDTVKGVHSTLKGHTGTVTSVALTPDGKTIVSGSDDMTVKVWDTVKGVHSTLKGHSGTVTSVALTLDGKTIVSGSDDMTVKVWDTVKGVHSTLKGHTGTVTSVALTLDGKTIVSGSDDMTVKVWDTVKGVHSTLKGHTGTVTSVALTPNGKTIVSGSYDKIVKVWNTETGAHSTLKGHTDWVYSVAVTLDGKMIVSGSDDMTVKVWDTETGIYTSTLEDHSDWVTSVAMTPDGKTIVSGSDDMTVKVWDTVKGVHSTLKGHTGTVTSVALTLDGKTIVSGSDDMTVKVWDTVKGVHSTLKGHTDTVNSVAVTLDGKTIVSGSSDTTVKVWDTVKGVHSTLKGHTGRVTSVAVTPDGKTIVSGSYDKTVNVWNTEKGEYTSILDDHFTMVTSVAVTLDGKTIVFGSDDMTIKVWNTEAGIYAPTLEGHTGTVYAVAVTPYGDTIVSGSDDMTVKVWDTKTRKCTSTLIGHSDAVYSVAVTSDGKTIAYDSSDMTVIAATYN